MWAISILHTTVQMCCMMCSISLLFNCCSTAKLDRARLFHLGKYLLVSILADLARFAEKKIRVLLPWIAEEEKLRYKWYLESMFLSKGCWYSFWSPGNGLFELIYWPNSKHLAENHNKTINSYAVYAIAWIQDIYGTSNILIGLWRAIHLYVLHTV